LRTVSIIEAMPAECVHNGLRTLHK